MSEKKAKELGIKPFVSVKAVAAAGADPTRTHLTVNAAVKKAMALADSSLKDMELIEIQEAFAAQVLADLKDMGVSPDDYEKVNVNGSGISLGHPIGATGVRVLVTLMHEMRRTGIKTGLECICGGGGLGIAAIFEGGQ
jgi:acetyl-CoA C-acetyltransferase